ncbi:hypothetical protein A7U60_g2297 [Sanghuangporus baumii]|uniref:Uncharacterized protein n=1 Tax=Sanghuangporus baumii TaxID=108892 RepID=A0A9Q5I2K7_SANBA|nr:hypothetical protein A7U60_g2297 [Sanghuangporus baumii]
MTEVASAPAVAVPLMPTHSASSAEDIHDTEVVDVLKAELEKAVKGVDVSGVGVDPAQKLDELQERVRSGDTIPEEKASKAEDPVLGLEETDADTVAANDAAVPLVDVDVAPPPPSAGPTEESVPEVQATPVGATADLDAKSGETGLGISPDASASAVEPTSEGKDAESNSESKAEPESESIPVDFAVSTQQPSETQIEAAKTEDIGEPEDIAATKTKAFAKEDAKEEVLDKVAEEPIEGQGEVNEPAEESIKEETLVGVPAHEVPLVIEAPATVEEVVKEDPSASALSVEAETKPRTLALIPVAAEAEEESPVDNDTTKDLPKEVEEEQKPTEDLVPSDSAPIEAVTPAPDAIVSEETAPAGEATQSEDDVDDAAKEEPVTEAAQETPSTNIPAVATSTNAAEPLAVDEEDKPKAVETETPAPDIRPAEEPIATGVQAEGSGVTIETEKVFEPTATPATGWTVTTEKAASSDVLAAIIDEVDELLQEESAAEAAEEVEETVPEVQAASAEEPAETQEPTAAVSDRAEVQESAVAVPGEETVEDVEPVTVAEPAETALAEQEPAASTEDEAKLEVEDDKRIPEAEEVRAPLSAGDASAATEGPIHTPEGTVGAPQAEAKPDSAEAAEAHESETIEDAEEEPEEVEVVPDVSIETPTPMSETLSFISSDEDEEDDVPVELRLAKAVGVPPEEVAKLPALSSSTPTETGAEDDATTPTKIVDETKPDEGKVEEETTAGGSQEHETPTQSILLEQPEDAEVVAPQAVNVDMNASETPERPKSPWTSSYSVITQGASPVHPEEPEEPKEEPAVEKAVDVVAELPPAEEVSQPSQVEDIQVLASVPVARAAYTQTIESVMAETPASETITDELPKPEETTVLAKSDAEQEVPTITEVHQAEPSDEPLIDEKPEAPLETVLAALAVDTSAKEVPDRPKSPWTPSYSVTQVGPGIPEPEELHLDADAPAESKLDASSEEQQAVAEEQAPSVHIDVTEVPQTDAPASESVPVIARPKSPYPPSYSVTQMGPGVVGGAATAGQLEEGGSIADSNEPEMPSTPRSELRSVTPGFDTLSEVSESSHIPNPPDSPRTDPEVTSLMEAEAKTPLVTSTEEGNKPISPLCTPLLSAKIVEGLGESSEPLTEAAVSGIEDAEPRPLLLEDDAVQEAGRPVLTEYATEETIIAAETADNHPSQAIETEDSILSAPELTIPKVGITAAHPALPVIVTNTLSTDSAYTQISDTFSPSQETGTNVTTPDIETMSVPKLHEGSEVESLGEEQSSTVTPTGTVGIGKSLGVAHTLAMRSFPSAFAQTEGPSASEQPTQVAEADTLEADTLEGDDQLSPLASRRRLESTASALAFPGGWVSSSVKKERTSLETATGVFSKPVVEGASISPVVTPPSTEPASEQSESKWRCIIM